MVLKNICGNVNLNYNRHLHKSNELDRKKISDFKSDFLIFTRNGK